MISVMHGRPLVDFVLSGAEAVAAALVVLCLAGGTGKSRKAEVLATGRIEFAPNRRAMIAWLIMASACAYLIPVQFVHANRTFSSLLWPVGFALIAILLLASFPGTILVDSEGLEQIFWIWKNKRIGWADIVEINSGGPVRVTGADGTKIVHSSQLPDRQRFLSELKEHCGEELPADFPREPISTS
ncbi:MAG: hypothetical protein WCC14_00500 [Acidobacteriaceae bacterium]